MQNFDYMTPTRLIFGKESIMKLPSVMAQFGKRILLTYGGGSIKKIGLYDRVKELLEGYDIVELSGIQPNPKTILRCSMACVSARSTTST